MVEVGIHEIYRHTSCRIYVRHARCNVHFSPERFGSIWWQTYSDPSGSFSLKFPSKPEVSNQQVKIDTGDNVLVHIVAATPNKTAAYFFSYYDYNKLASNTAEEAFNLARDRAISSVHGEFLDEQHVQIGGYQGRDVQVRLEENLISNMRLIADGQQLVILSVVTIGQQADSKNVQRFFDSLKLSN